MQKKGKVILVLSVLLLAGAIAVNAVVNGQPPLNPPGPTPPTVTPTPTPPTVTPIPTPTIPPTITPTPTPLPTPTPAPGMPGTPGAAPGGISTHMPMIGEAAPAFAAETTQGTIHFPQDFKGKWVILFSHPADFTPVCTTELMTFAKMTPEFEALNCKLIGLSVDSTSSHIAWMMAMHDKINFKGMEKVDFNFPVIADIKMDVARQYGMIQPTASDTKAVRAVFFIDPDAKVRAILYYPLTNGRNFQEIKRLLTAMQTTDQHKCSTPADWQPGDDVIVPAPASPTQARQRLENPPKDAFVYDWFLTTRKLPLEQINTGGAKK